MKKNKKDCMKFIVGTVVGITITSTSVYAAVLYQGSNVQYSKTASGLNSTNVQSAIDEIQGKIDETRTEMGLQKFKIKLLESDNTTLIKTYTYYYQPGMTWDQFINSSISGGTFQNDSNVYHKVTGRYIHSINSNGGYYVEKPSDTIRSITYVMSEDLCCFDPNTLITIDFEGNTKKIKDIEVGDMIVVENVHTKEKYLTTALKDANEHPRTRDMTEITLEDGTELRFNSYHPIYTTEGYKSVTNYNHYAILEEGDYAVDYNNQKKKIIKINRYRTEKQEMTYNLLIKGINEFHLEEEYAYIANNTLVHTGIAEYDDEDEYRAKKRSRCTQEDVYKDFDYDNATEEELIKYLVELKVSNEEAFNEYVKYYISAEQYYRYVTIARIVKDKSKELSNINTLHHIRRNTKLSSNN